MSEVFDPARWRPAPFLPEAEARDGTLLFVVGVLCFLACLTAMGVIAANRAAQGWTGQLTGEATVIVRPRGGETPDAAAARAAEALSGTAGVAEARALEPAKAYDLIRPWLGDVSDLEDLPVPRLVAVTLDRKQPADAGKLKAALAAGTITIGQVDAAVGRILGQYQRIGLLDGRSKHTVTPEPVTRDEQVVRQTGAAAAVLLENDGILPLRGEDVALIGPGAGQTMATGGGGEASTGLASRWIGAVDTLRAVSPQTRIAYAPSAARAASTRAPPRRAPAPGRARCPAARRTTRKGPTSGTGGTTGRGSRRCARSASACRTPVSRTAISSPAGPATAWRSPSGSPTPDGGTATSPRRSISAPRPPRAAPSSRSRRWPASPGSGCGPASRAR